MNKAEILYMSSLLGRYTQTNSGKNSFHVQYSINHLFLLLEIFSEEVMNQLNDAVDSHFRAVRGLTFGPEYLTVMNPDFVVLLVKEYLMYAPNNPATQGQAIAAPLKKSLMVLEPVTKARKFLYEKK